MSARRIAVHILTAYPPSNPNRDDNGEPKTAVVGGKTRQRISSQCIKRAWRLSAPMQELQGHFATRTRGLGNEIVKVLQGQGVGSKDAMAWAKAIAEAFGKIDKKREPDHAEMVVIGREEWDAVMALATKLGVEKRGPTDQEIKALPQMTTSIDCALFGRMRAKDPGLNLDAAVAVSHPLTVNQASIDSDFWTSVDDLKSRDEDADRGSGGMGDVEYGSGVYYTYAEIGVDELTGNLGDNAQLARQTIPALIRAMATTVPGGHRSTFGNSVRAGYLRVEMGESSGNLFCSAYETPLTGMKAAVEALRSAADRELEAYGLKADVAEMSVVDSVGTLADVIGKVARYLEGAR